MTTEEKARRSFDYGCRQASKCRHERYKASCYDCKDAKTCDIQARIEKARLKMD